MSDFKNMTVVELKAYAKDNNIDLKDIKTKTKILAALNNIKADISLAEEPETVIGSTTIFKEKRFQSLLQSQMKVELLLPQQQILLKTKILKKIKIIII